MSTAVQSFPRLAMSETSFEFHDLSKFWISVVRDPHSRERRRRPVLLNSTLRLLCRDEVNERTRPIGKSERLWEIVSTNSCFSRNRDDNNYNMMGMRCTVYARSINIIILLNGRDACAANRHNTIISLILNRCGNNIIAVNILERGGFVPRGRYPPFIIINVASPVRSRLPSASLVARELRLHRHSPSLSCSEIRGLGRFLVFPTRSSADFAHKIV